MIMCTPYIFNYYLCDFLEIVDNEKNREKWWAGDDVYIMHVKRYAIRTCSGLERWCGIWWCVHATCQENCVTNSLEYKFKHKFELQVYDQFNKSNETTQTASLQLHIPAWRSSRNRNSHQEPTTTEVITHMDKTKVIQHRFAKSHVVPMPSRRSGATTTIQRDAITCINR
jgi:hypothetical protein